MEVLNGLRNLDLTEGKYHESKALIACNSGKVVHLEKSFHVTSVTKQWRMCFVWQNGNAYDVEIIDYH